MTDMFNGIGPGSEVKIEWTDSRIVSTGPITFDDALRIGKPSSCVTYGMVIGFANGGIIIAQSTSEDRIRGVICIPMSAIRKITTI